MAEWLEAKGFSPAARKALRVPGHQLFALSRAQLERALGADEGKRLYSQVLVQRNVSGVSRACIRSVSIVPIVSRCYGALLTALSSPGRIRDCVLYAQYKTTSASELQSILRKVREKVEVS